MNAEKWIWPIFGGKVGVSIPIVTKLKLNVSRHLLGVYDKLQIDISKQVKSIAKKTKFW